MSTTTTTGVHPHQSVINGLRDLADFLEDHPGLPLGAAGDVRAAYYVRAETTVVDPDVDGLARLALIAKELGTEVTGTCGSPIKPDETHFFATRSFGPVSYQACYIRRRATQDWEALMSYDGAVRPGDRS